MENGRLKKNWNSFDYYLKIAYWYIGVPSAEPSAELVCQCTACHVRVKLLPFLPARAHKLNQFEGVLCFPVMLLTRCIADLAGMKSYNMASRSDARLRRWSQLSMPTLKTPHRLTGGCMMPGL